MSRCLVAAAFAVITILASTHALRADAPTRVHGIVWYGTEWPVQGALVTVSFLGAGLRETRTDQNGRFTLLALENGSADMTVEAAGLVACISRLRIDEGDDLNMTWRMHRDPPMVGQCRPAVIDQTTTDRYVIR